MEIEYHAHIVETDIDCGHHFCGPCSQFSKFSDLIGISITLQLHYIIQGVSEYGFEYGSKFLGNPNGGSQTGA